ncbi:hypothetical protein ACVINZ_004527 [Mesorhizobium jarvisii]
MNTHPSRLALCIILARSNHAMGVLLHSIVYWAKYGKAVIPKATGTWVANERSFWMQEARLSSDQYDRCIRSLHKWQLIEKRQWWFGGKNILHVRPSTATLDYLQSASTWEAANELAPATMHGSISKMAEPGSAVLLKSNEVGNSAEPETVKPLNSKSVIHGSVIDGLKALTGEHPATPAFAGEEKSKASYGKGNNSMAAAQPAGAMELPEDYPMKPTIAEMREVWSKAVDKYYGDLFNDQPCCGSLSAKDIGQLALFLESLSSILTSQESQLDFTGSALDVLHYAVRCWGEWTAGLWMAHKQKFPSPSFLYENLGPAIYAWDQDGRPPRP